MRIKKKLSNISVALYATFFPYIKKILSSNINNSIIRLFRCELSTVGTDFAQQTSKQHIVAHRIEYIVGAEHSSHVRARLFFGLTWTKFTTYTYYIYAVYVMICYVMWYSCRSCYVRIIPTHNILRAAMWEGSITHLEHMFQFKVINKYETNYTYGEFWLYTISCYPVRFRQSFAYYKYLEYLDTLESTKKYYKQVRWRISII